MAARRYVVAVAIAGGIGATACNAILGIDPPTVVADDGGARDGGGGGDGGPVVQGNVLENSDFENGSCDGWFGGSASLTVAPISHGSGKYSCLVCQDVPSAGVYTVGQNIDVTKVTEGVTYVVQAWVRLPDPDSGLSPASALSIGIDVASGLSESPAGNVTSDDWTLVSDSVPYGALDGDVPTTSVLNRSQDNGCFLVDDYTMSPKTN